VTGKTQRAEHMTIKPIWTKPIWVTSIALAVVFLGSTMSLSADLSQPIKTDTKVTAVDGQTGLIALANGLTVRPAFSDPRHRLADKLLVVSDQTKQVDARYRASAT
jgi:hypothetical protein